jgi:DNA helicase-2/ATP-dependent DNA helicase PcrA
MDNYEKEMQKEKAYLEKTLAFIRKELEAGSETLSNRKDKLIAARRDMWENTAHSTRDFTKLTEINQHLMEINNQTTGYKNLMKQIEKYERILGTPYFGRFDFLEDGEASEEKNIYRPLQCNRSQNP